MPLPAEPERVGGRTEATTRHLDPLTQIKPGRWQNRREFPQEELEGLAESIREQGVIEPLIVRFDRKDGLYEIVAGERRWRAAIQAGEPTVPVIVRNDLDDRQARVLCLVENLQRQDLNPIEEARGYRELLDTGLTQAEAARKLGVGRSHIANMVRLLDLAPQVQGYVIDGLLDAGHVKPLLTLEPRQQVRIAEQAVRFGWNVRRIEQQVADARKLSAGEIPGTRRTPADPDLDRLARRIGDAAGLPAQLKVDKQGGGGRLTLRFHSPEELEGLLERLQVDYRI